MTLRRSLLALLTTGLVAATTLLVATPAQAAWTPSVRWHGAVTQACKAALGNGKVRVHVRVNNTNGTDRATGGLNRVRANGQPATRGPTRATSPEATSATSSRSTSRPGRGSG